MSEDLNTKSLGEKLYEATHGPGLWADLVAASQSYYEKVALAFAASLSHDETANAVITDLRQRLQAAEERAEKAEAALRIISDGTVSSAPEGHYLAHRHAVKVARAALKTEGA